ncbi:hypothetical protein DH2020_025249 [Rehmannia glutinosa]|uniref:Uncharacterized protein n=1 Tax=Rehmannia glutinosa TaxID=99300 RepID=A0ABR0W2W6_REHGL
MLKCLAPERVGYIMQEIHRGCCGNHSGGRSLALKTRLEQMKTYWVDEIPGVLWAYRRTPKTVMGETPFCLLYGSKAVIPLEIGEPHRIENYDGNENQENMVAYLDLIEERSECAYGRILLARMMNEYNKRVMKRNIQVGDLVLKKVEVSKHVGKLDPNWEGPYKVVRVSGKGAYRLEDLQGKELHRPWNAHNLRRFYA